MGEELGELLKLAAVLLFGVLLIPKVLVHDIGLRGYAFAVLALVAARPVALRLSFLGAPLSAREQVAATWFGPKGFSSVVYAPARAAVGMPEAQVVYHLAAVVIALSIVVHASTDVVVARQFAGPSSAWDRRRSPVLAVVDSVTGRDPDAGRGRRAAK